MNIESIRQFVSWMTTTELFSPELYFLSKLPAEIDSGETITVLLVMASGSCPFWQRSIQPGVRRGSIRSKRSGMNRETGR